QFSLISVGVRMQLVLTTFSFIMISPSLYPRMILRFEFDDVSRLNFIALKLCVVEFQEYLSVLLRFINVASWCFGV
ncbi:MAG: hypothetical protein MJA83_12950, partial [Gammaproteobacteria bacterium]|nr:hypothetical protein [Gammaproteobacteria bacterium]